MPNDAPKFTLAELADIDVTQVDEIRFEVLPKMSGTWKIKDCKLDMIGQDQKVAIILEAEPLTISAVLDEAYKDQSTWQKLTEKVHRESFFIKEATDVGRFKAFAVDVGIGIPEKGSGEKIPLAQLMEAVKGLEFAGRIDHSTSKDGNRTFANLRPIIEKKK